MRPNPDELDYRLKMVEVIERSNLLEVQSGIVCHQVNCIGVMGAGLALQLRNKWPVVFDRYKDECRHFVTHPEAMLGHVQDVMVGDNLIVANCFAQVFPDRDGVMTDYNAWNVILDKLADLSNYFSLDLHFPWMIGCGLAGGDWNVILGKIKSQFGHGSTQAFIHRL